MLHDEICIFLKISDRDKEDGVRGRGIVMNTGVRKTNKETGLIPGSGRSPGEGNDYPLQNSCLENSMDRGAWSSIVYGISKSQT